ncbi:MAG: FtsX-like permease family protein [Propionibacteriaceae bacterium]|jgi:putative ABC transport system permease protein|nr:FtsX-like permease family protein [Propionibacteriaceae bacterium]
MFKLASRELRYHSGRFAATLIAIAISVGFMTAASVVTGTLQESMAQQRAAQYGKADLSVEAYAPDPGFVAATAVSAQLTATPGVTAVEKLETNYGITEFSGSNQYVEYYALPSEQFRWANLLEGTWPQAANEVALGQTTMEALHAKLGDSVVMAGAASDPLLVVGVTDDRSSLWSYVGYFGSQAFFQKFGQNDTADGTYLVQADSDPDALAAQLEAALKANGFEATVQTHEQILADARKGMGDYEVWKWILWSFAGIAAVVGMITISNTFSILLAGRRRQIGMLRAVGAFGGQVRRSVFIEALLLGAAGALLGIGLGIAVSTAGVAYLGMLAYGLVLPASDLAIAGAVGVAITLLAAFVPTLRSTRVAPLEALRPVPQTSERRAGIVRMIFCGILAMSGGWLIFQALHADDDSLLMAIGGSALLAVGVLFGAPLFVPLLLRLVGAVISLFGPLPRLAAKNVVRNPKRASATATALMLAIGLIITLQVGTASVRKTALDEISKNYPVDLQVRSYPNSDSVLLPLSADMQMRLPQVRGVQAAVSLAGVEAELVAANGAAEWLTVLGWDSQIPAVVDNAPSSIPDDTMYVGTGFKGDTASINGREFHVVKSAMAGDGIVLVSPAALSGIGPQVANVAMWLSVDGAQATNAYADVTDMLDVTGTYDVSGGLMMSATMEQVLNILMAVVTALLGVAVLIALVGVSNTLTLSVLERQRESALMRALGLQKSGLRLMLLIEALMLAGVGALVGVAAGVFFGWVGVNALARESVVAGGDMAAAFSVDLVWTFALLGVAVAVAALASILPGRRAASAPPVEALADI